MEIGYKVDSYYLHRKQQKTERGAQVWRGVGAADHSRGPGLHGPALPHQRLEVGHPQSRPRTRPRAREQDPGELHVPRPQLPRIRDRARL